MIHHRGTARLAVNRWATVYTSASSVVVGNPAAMLPVSAGVDVATAAVVVIGRNVDVIGAIANPVAAAPLPISAAPVPRAVNPHVAVAGGCTLLLVEWLWRHALHSVCLARAYCDIPSALNAWTLSLHGTTGGKGESRAKGQSQWGEGQLSLGHIAPSPFHSGDWTDEAPQRFKA